MLTAGEGEPADGLLARGATALRARREAGETIDPVEAGFLVLEHGRRLVTRGQLDQAQELFEEAVTFAVERGAERSAAIARGEIAALLFRRGKLDEALRIRREEELPVYERLGDVRSRAVGAPTWRWRWCSSTTWRRASSRRWRPPCATTFCCELFASQRNDHM